MYSGAVPPVATPGEATAKIRPLAEGRRLRTYLATGTYRDELAEARWVA